MYGVSLFIAVFSLLPLEYHWDQRDHQTPWSGAQILCLDLRIPQQHFHL